MVEDKSLKEKYNQWYSQSESAHWEDAPGKAVLISALRRCCSVDKALCLVNIGCGSGSFLERISAQVSTTWKLRGADFSEVAIMRAKAQYPSFEFWAGDATQLPYDTASVDIVTCYGSWEHFPAPEQRLSKQGEFLSQEAGFLP